MYSLLTRYNYASTEMSSKDSRARARSPWILSGRVSSSPRASRTSFRTRSYGPLRALVPNSLQPSTSSIILLSARAVWPISDFTSCSRDILESRTVSTRAFAFRTSIRFLAESAWVSSSPRVSETSSFGAHFSVWWKLLHVHDSECDGSKLLKVVSATNNSFLVQYSCIFSSLIRSKKRTKFFSSLPFDHFPPIAWVQLSFGWDFPGEKMVRYRTKAFSRRFKRLLSSEKKIL